MLPIRFQPLYFNRVWGGRNFSAELNRALPQSDQPIGESWEIVDREEAQSVIMSEPDVGQNFCDVLATDGPQIMGPNWQGGRFPLLIKWLDCQQRLSLQVHPPEDKAEELGGEPKTENWYVWKATPEAGLLVGLKNGTTREEFEQRLQNNTLEECVHRIDVSSGESMFVRSGRIHAIDGGNLILEIQQNSDTTYRVYDWGRPRELHVEQSLKSIDFNDFEPETIKPAPGEQVLADSEIFRIRKLDLEAGKDVTFAANEEPRLLCVVEGQVKINGARLSLGENILLPYAGAFTLSVEDPAKVMVTDRFV